MNYFESIEFLLSLPDMERCSSGPLARSMSLETMKFLLEKLQNPEKNRHTVHITGSKGKGSTSTYIASVLSKISKTSLYTSPHLHSYQERICFNLEPVSKEYFAMGLSQIKEKILEVHQSNMGPMSTFGALTALYFYLSEQMKIEWQVVEVGLGGLYDATNVFSFSDFVIITAISLEHTNILGKSVAEIAANKAGIIKPGSKVILAKQNDNSVFSTIKDICIEKEAELVYVPEHYQYSLSKFDEYKQEFQVESKYCSTKRAFQISMLGEHQVDNALTTISFADQLVLKVGEEVLKPELIFESLANTSVPGRMELISNKPKIILDGAHNGESMLSMAKSLRKHFKSSQIIIILGVNSDKNIFEIIEALKFLKENSVQLTLIATISSSAKAMEASLVQKIALEQNIECLLGPDLLIAIETAISLLGDENGIICICGSLYLVADARRAILEERLDYELVKGR